MPLAFFIDRLIFFAPDFMPDLIGFCRRITFFKARDAGMSILLVVDHGKPSGKRPCSSPIHRAALSRQPLNQDLQANHPLLMALQQLLNPFLGPSLLGLQRVEVFL